MSETKVEFSSDEAEEYLYDIAATSAITLAKAVEYTNPVEIHVLRSHLWMEREIEQILEQLFPYPQAIIESRFTFAHKLTLLKAFWGNEPTKSELLSKLNTVNQIRNQMAHELNSPKLTKLFEKIDIEYTLGINDVPNDKVLNRVQLRLAGIQGELIGIKSVLLLNKAGHSIITSKS